MTPSRRPTCHGWKRTSGRCWRCRASLMPRYGTSTNRARPLGGRRCASVIDWSMARRCVATWPSSPPACVPTAKPGSGRRSRFRGESCGRDHARWRRPHRSLMIELKRLFFMRFSRCLRLCPALRTSGLDHGCTQRAPEGKSGDAERSPWPELAVEIAQNTEMKEHFRMVKVCPRRVTSRNYRAFGVLSPRPSTRLSTGCVDKPESPILAGVYAALLPAPTGMGRKLPAEAPVA